MDGFKIVANAWWGSSFCYMGPRKSVLLYMLSIVASH